LKTLTSAVNPFGKTFGASFDKGFHAGFEQQGRQRLFDVGFPYRQKLFYAAARAARKWPG